MTKARPVEDFEAAAPIRGAKRRHHRSQAPSRAGLKQLGARAALQCRVLAGTWTDTRHCCYIPTEERRRGNLLL